MFGFFGGLSFINIDLVAVPQTKNTRGDRFLYNKGVGCEPQCCERQPFIAIEQEIRYQQCKPRRPYRPNMRPSLETIDEEKTVLKDGFLQRNRCKVLFQLKRSCELTFTKIRHKIHARPHLSSGY